MDELCPICIENPAEIITNCNHTFCICCLSRITKCAICRSPLQRVKLCIEIKTYTRNLVVSTRLNLNRQYRFSERARSYFSQVQPYQLHTRCPVEGINVYSFALRPERHQPSRTCNFLRIENAPYLTL